MCQALFYALYEKALEEQHVRTYKNTGLQTDRLDLSPSFLEPQAGHLSSLV